MMRGGSWLFKFIGLTGMVLAWAGLAGSAPPTTIRFNHQFHLGEDVELECSACHAAAESQASGDRLLPTMEVCGECHDVEDDEGCALCHTDMDNMEQIDIPPREIAFSHQAHLGYEGTTCQTCHAGMEKVVAPGGTHVPDMAACMACHDNTAGPSACNACHTDLAHLKPASHAGGWAREHGRRVRTGDAACASCHAQSECQECHEGAKLSVSHPSLGSRGAFAPQSRGDAGLVLKGAHELNYRFTHALDAKGKARRCAVCHDRATFCVECHNPDSDADAFRPVWHNGADWGAIAGAVGSGGGRHARLARRDMERCAACHDMQGDDPTCTLCHMDRLPGRGNDPKTHGARFKSQVGNGGFHDNPNSICFNCHTLKGPAGGAGFCGYCHGAK